MTFNSHIVIGLILGAYTDHYSQSVLFSLLPDIDHLPSLLKHGLLKNPKKLLSTTLAENDQHQDQRGILHNLAISLPVLTFIYFYFPNLRIFAIAIFFHLILDMLDTAQYFPLSPNKKFSFKGFIKYNSFQEVIFSIIISSLAIYCLP
ncbi:metal-dependent hydrolase [Patescibacteria group bacterium]